MHPSGVLAASIALLIGAVLAACNRDAPPPAQPLAAGAAPPGAVQQVPLVPGLPSARRPSESPHKGDAQARAEGKRLYMWMNCAGCHFEGGGGIGPALMDVDWIYGGQPAQIFDSIAAGRANGMPAYGDKLSTDQIWLIVEHVISLGETAGDPKEKAEKGAAGGEQ